MITHESSRDTPYVRGEINKDRRECSQLNHRHRSGDLCRISVIEIRKTACEYQVSRRTDRDEFGQALDYAEDYRLYQIHKICGLFGLAGPEKKRK